jgi:hypothetical protein
LVPHSDLRPSPHKEEVLLVPSAGAWEALTERETAATVNCETREVLRASHIVPWKKAKDCERLDGANGLLLNATLDALFDRGLISFDDEGTMLISKSLPLADKQRLGLTGGMKLSSKPIEKQREYLGRHREDCKDRWRADLQLA